MTFAERIKEFLESKIDVLSKNNYNVEKCQTCQQPIVSTLFLNIKEPQNSETD